MIPYRYQELIIVLPVPLILCLPLKQFHCFCGFACKLEILIAQKALYYVYFELSLKAPIPYFSICGTSMLAPFCSLLALPELYFDSSAP